VAHTTAEAVHAISQRRPRVIVVDWNADGIDGPTICMAVASFASTGILALIDDPMLAPAPLKAGCHAILLRPCPLNLVAARIGRLSREMPTTATSNGHGTRQQIGTNNVWVGTACPACGHDGGTSFEFSSHRRMWYACLACDHVWFGSRQE
jgi:DNA-binding response OmpR family regulator